MKNYFAAFVFVLVALLFSAAGIVAEQEPVTIKSVDTPAEKLEKRKPPTGKRAAGKGPVIGLVLEGGGALGFAHVGVLKVLEEERIPIGVIAGTSMGSIVGAAYASGRSMEEIDAVISQTDWDQLFNETLARELVTYRMKTGRDGEIYGDTKIGIVNGDVTVPTAMVEGQQIEPLFQKLFGRAPAACSFDDLPVPYRAVAADIETGQAVVLDHGSLTQAARASMSVPGFFSPVEIDGRLLVDGGITNNFPVDVARSMGADHLIGVEFKFTPRKRNAMTNPLTISAQILDLMLERTSATGRALMGPEDVLINPDVSAFSSTSFGSSAELVAAGEAAARAAIPQLKKFAVSETEYAAYSKRRTSGSEYAPVIDYIRVAKAPPHREKAIIKAMNVKLGEKFDRDDVSRQVEAIHETGIYKKVTADIEEKEGKHGLVVTAEEKEWLKNYVRLGFSLEDNLDGNSSYALAANARLRELNSAGAYLDNQVEIGRAPRIFSEFYQPIYESSSFFVAPDISLSRTPLLITKDNNQIAEYERESAVLALKGGYSLGRYGEIVSGWKRGPGTFERQIGAETLPEFDYDIGEYFSRVVLDQYDNPDFPTEGYRAIVEGLASRESAGGSGDFEQGRANFGVPFTSGDTTLLLNAEGGWSSPDLPEERAFSLGGFLDISGFVQNSKLADNYWISRTALYRRFSKGSTSLINFGGFYGASLEYANLKSDIEEIGDSPDIIAGSIFIAADTPLLPLYFGIGMNDESEKSFYLAIGRVGGRRR